MLLDSHVVLWLLDGSPRLGPECRQRLAAADNVYFSAASVWELRIKQCLGKLTLPDEFVQYVKAAGIRELAVTGSHADAICTVELPHRDPFDRLLLAQATHECLTLCTADRKLLAVHANILDARR